MGDTSNLPEILWVLTRVRHVCNFSCFLLSSRTFRAAKIAQPTTSDGEALLMKVKVHYTPWYVAVLLKQMMLQQLVRGVEFLVEATFHITSFDLRLSKTSSFDRFIWQEHLCLLEAVKNPWVTQTRFPK